MPKSKKDMKVETMLSDDQYDAMQEVVEVKGLTVMGYVRNLIIIDTLEFQEQVSRYNNKIANRKNNGKS